MTIPILFALESLTIGLGVFVVLVFAALLLVPYLYEEIHRGKVELGPRVPTGAGDTHPGRRGNPAPGQPDGQSDPYELRAQR